MSGAIQNPASPGAHVKLGEETISPEQAQSMLLSSIAEWSIGGEAVANSGAKTKPGAKPKAGGSGEAGAAAGGAHGSDPLLPPEGESSVTIAGMTSAAGSCDMMSSCTDGMLAVMMNEVAKYALQDQRMDRKFATAMKNLALAAKSEKLKLDNKSTLASMDESRTKAGNLMDAATTQMWTGIVGGLAQMAGGICSATGNTVAAGVGEALKGAGEVGKSIGNFYAQKAQADNLLIDANAESSKLKIQSNNQQIIADAQQAMADKADEGKKGSEDHLRAVKDAIKKMLDQMGELGRNTKIY